MKTYVVAGGSKGIGRAIVESLCTAGHRVIVLSRSENGVSSLPNIVWHNFDFSSNDKIDVALPEAIDGLVYAPGSINLKPFNRLTEADFQADLQINFLGAVQCIQWALPALKKSPQASVVMFSTVAVQTGLPFHASIAAAKGAIEGLTKSLAAELATQIRVNAIAPSLTNTPLAEKLLNTPEKIEAANKRHPLGRVGTPQDIAETALFLLSEKSAWITGQILHVDGGMGSIKL